jgi:MraZ protein
VEQYLGSQIHSLDPQGRIAIPKVFLETLVEAAGSKKELAIGYGPDRKLLLLPKRDVKNAFQSFISSPFSTKQVANSRAVFFGTMQVCVPDKQGRIVIPEKMVKYARFQGSVAFVGTGDLVELWDATEWETYSDAQVQSGDLVAQMRESCAAASLDANRPRGGGGRS